MKDPKTTPQQPAHTPVPAQHTSEQRGPDRTTEDRPGKTVVLPGTPLHGTQDEHADNTHDRIRKADPDPVHGIVSNSHRGEAEAPSHDKEQDAHRKGSGPSSDLPNKDQARDQDKDREEPLKGHKVGDDKPQHTTKAKS